MITLPEPREAVRYFGGGSGSGLIAGVKLERKDMNDSSIKVGGGIATNNGELAALVVVAVINKLTGETTSQFSLGPAEAMELSARLMNTACEVNKDLDVFMFVRDNAIAQGHSMDAAQAVATQHLTALRAMRQTQQQPQQPQQPGVPN